MCVHGSCPNSLDGTCASAAPGNRASWGQCFGGRCIGGGNLWLPMWPWGAGRRSGQGGWYGRAVVLSGQVRTEAICSAAGGRQWVAGWPLRQEGIWVLLTNEGALRPAGGCELNTLLSFRQVQGMSFIAAVLILNLDTEDAFIAFSNLLNKPCQMAFFRVDHGLVSIPCACAPGTVSAHGESHLTVSSVGKRTRFPLRRGIQDKCHRRRRRVIWARVEF